MTDDNRALRTRVFTLPQTRGMTLTQLAARMGVALSLVTRVRRGERGIGQTFINGALRAFPELSLDDLFYADSPTARGESDLAASDASEDLQTQGGSDAETL